MAWNFSCTAKKPGFEQDEEPTLSLKCRAANVVTSKTSKELIGFSKHLGIGRFSINGYVILGSKVVLMDLTFWNFSKINCKEISDESVLIECQLKNTAHIRNFCKEITIGDEQMEEETTIFKFEVLYEEGVATLQETLDRRRFRFFKGERISTIREPINLSLKEGASSTSSNTKTSKSSESQKVLMTHGKATKATEKASIAHRSNVHNGNKSYESSKENKPLSSVTSEMISKVKKRAMPLENFTFESEITEIPRKPISSMPTKHRLVDDNEPEEFDFLSSLGEMNENNTKKIHKKEKPGSKVINGSKKQELTKVSNAKDDAFKKPELKNQKKQAPKITRKKADEIENEYGCDDSGLRQYGENEMTKENIQQDDEFEFVCSNETQNVKVSIKLPDGNFSIRDLENFARTYHPNIHSEYCDSEGRLKRKYRKGTFLKALQLATLKLKEKETSAKDEENFVSTSISPTRHRQYPEKLEQKNPVTLDSAIMNNARVNTLEFSLSPKDPKEQKDHITSDSNATGASTLKYSQNGRKSSDPKELDDKLNGSEIKKTVGELNSKFTSSEPVPSTSTKPQENDKARSSPLKLPPMKRLIDETPTLESAKRRLNFSPQVSETKSFNLPPPRNEGSLVSSLVSPIPRSRMVEAPRLTLNETKPKRRRVITFRDENQEEYSQKESDTDSIEEEELDADNDFESQDVREDLVLECDRSARALHRLVQKVNLRRFKVSKKLQRRLKILVKESQDISNEISSKKEAFINAYEHYQSLLTAKTLRLQEREKYVLERTATISNLRGDSSKILREVSRLKNEGHATSESFFLQLKEISKKNLVELEKLVHKQKKEAKEWKSFKP